MRQFHHIAEKKGPAELARRAHLDTHGLKCDISSQELDEQFAAEFRSTFADPANSTITELSIADNPMGDEGAVNLAWALTEHKALTDLHLEQCAIADIGASTRALCA